MKIYTRAGDKGDTSLPGGQRVRKTDPAIEALGATDELAAHVGLCLQAARKAASDAVANALGPVQGELLAVCAMLAASPGQSPKVRFASDKIERMERTIDDVAARLPSLDRFVLPGGSELACLLHVARAVCRRAERRIVALSDVAAGRCPEVIPAYVNRLGDMLFVLARLANLETGVGETTWPPAKEG